MTCTVHERVVKFQPNLVTEESMCSLSYLKIKLNVHNSSMIL